MTEEIVGTLRGFDDYVNMVIDDVREYSAVPAPAAARTGWPPSRTDSDRR